MWAEKAFKQKSYLFKIIMSYKWKFADRDTLIIRKILERFGIKQGNIIDVMCGDGRIAINLAKYGYNVTGIDFSETFIRDAINKARELGLDRVTRFICHDARRIDTLNFPVKFDAALLVWSSLGYYSKEDDIELLKQINRITKTKGTLIIFDILLKENYKPFQLFSVFFQDKYQVYSIEIYKASEGKLLRTWRLYEIRNDNYNKYLGEIKVELIIYSKKELISIIQEAGWRQVSIKSVIGINYVTAQK